MFVRLRPPRMDEGEPTMQFDGSGQRLWLQGERDPKVDSAATPLQFDFDGILPSDIQQQDVYESVARPLVEAATAGHSACLMLWPDGHGKDVHVWRWRPPPLLQRWQVQTNRGQQQQRQQQQQQQRRRRGSSPSGSVGGGSSSGGGGGGKKTTSGGRARSASPVSHPTGADAARDAKRAASAERKASRGSRSSDETSDQKNKQGVVGRALRQIIDWAAPRHMKVCISYVQVYMELLQDLLRPESTLSCESIRSSACTSTGVLENRRQGGGGVRDGGGGGRAADDGVHEAQRRLIPLPRRPPHRHPIRG